MNVAVAVTDVAVLEESFEIEGATIPERYRTYELNEWDEYAIEEAVRLAEDGIAEEVVTVTIGPERTDETIRKALAKGADRAIRIWDDALGERAYLDSRLKARLLSATFAEESPELVLAGVQTADDMCGATGVMAASRLGYGWAAIVTDLTVDPETDTAHVRRELEGGVEEVVELELPAICTIQTGINEPRYASLRGIRMAQRADIDVRSLADIGLDESVIRQDLVPLELRRPTSTDRGERYEGTPSETAARLADFLRERGVGA